MISGQLRKRAKTTRKCMQVFLLLYNVLLKTLLLVNLLKSFKNVWRPASGSCLLTITCVICNVCMLVFLYAHSKVYTSKLYFRYTQVNFYGNVGLELCVFFICNVTISKFHIVLRRFWIWDIIWQTLKSPQQWHHLSVSTVSSCMKLKINYEEIVSCNW